MLSDPTVWIRDLEGLLRETESLTERLAPSLAEARRKVQAIEGLRRGLEAFGEGELLPALAPHVEGLRETLRRIEGKLRASLGETEGSAPVHGTEGAPAVDRAREEPGAIAAAPHAEVGHAGEAPAAEPTNGNGHGAAPALPAVGSRIVLPLRTGRGALGAPAAAILPPDPEDLERIRQLEEDCEREFARLPFAGEEGRHAILTLCAAKARRLRTRLRDSYAVDRRLGDLIRKIVDLKRRYRLGWIDGCERSFDVPDWDAYVERCDNQLRELRAREQARLEDGRVARERAGQIAHEVERRGRELRHYLETDEGRLGTEPEKLRAALMSYLAVEGPLDPDLLESLRGHKSLFTGIAFRRLRKALERVPGQLGSDDDASPEGFRMRERVVARLRGTRAVMFASAAPDDLRRKLEQALGVEQMPWIDMTTLDALAWQEFARQLDANEFQYVLRAPSNSTDAVSAWTENQFREALRRGSAKLIDLDKVEESEALFASIDRALAETGGRRA